MLLNLNVNFNSILISLINGFDKRDVTVAEQLQCISYSLHSVP